jgi:hypothetical protein
MKVLSKILVFFAFVYVSLLGYSLAWSSGLIEPTRTLERTAEKSGKLSVFSEPPGLDVSLDGARIGKTPIISKVVESGYHVLRVKREETEIYVGPGKDLRLSLHKGSIIEIPAETKEIRQQKKPDDVKTSKKSKFEQSSKKKEELHPLYWPFNPSGPIY